MPYFIRKLLALVLLLISLSANAYTDGRYVIHTEGSMVLDKTTNLVWQRCSVGQTWNGNTCIGEAKTFTFDQAQQLSQDGWRVPTIRELQSLRYCSTGFYTKDMIDLEDGGETVPLNCNDNAIKPTINTAVFPNTQKWYWSSSPDVGNSDYAWDVYFYVGYVYNSNGYSDFVRLVRASQSLGDAVALGFDTPKTEVINSVDIDQKISKAVEAPVAKDNGNILNVSAISTLIKAGTSNNELRDEWAVSISNALKAIKLKPTQDNVCAVISIIAQESTFQIRPQVPNIGDILLNNIESLKNKGFLWKVGINVRLNQERKEGVTFLNDIKNLTSEYDLEEWYKDFTKHNMTEPILNKMGKSVDDVVATAGSMQVSISYAKKFLDTQRLNVGDIRRYLNTRDGGVLVGTAHLLDYDKDYSNWVYVFADYNAGRYASRNAGFQKMVSSLSKIELDFDGDILIYKGKKHATKSKTFYAIIKLLKDRGEVADEEHIFEGLLSEKESRFINEDVYKIVSKIHQNKYGYTIKEEIPKIALKSQKFKRALSTEWFAKRVYDRFKKCMNVNINS